MEQRRPSHKNHPGRSFRSKASATLAAVSAASGAYLMHGHDARAEANRLQPGCEVGVQTPRGTDAIIDDLHRAGDRNISFVGVMTPDHKRFRTTKTDGMAPGGSAIHQPGDLAEFTHVRPDACLAVGGKVVAETIQKPQIVEASTK